MSIRYVTIGIATSLTIFFILLILSTLLFAHNLNSYLKLTFDPRILFSIRLSLITASIATLIALVIALPTAYALSRYNFFGKRLIDTIMELPLILSPVALGAVLLIFFSTNLGLAIQNKSINFVYAVPGIILAQFVTVVGVAIRLLKASFDQIPPRLEDVARSLGASSWQSFWQITLPLAKRAIFSSALLAWAKALGEFGATITLAGSMPMKTETLPIAIFNALSGAQINTAVALILILAAIGLAVLYVVRILLRGEQLDWH